MTELEKAADAVFLDLVLRAHGAERAGELTRAKKLRALASELEEHFPSLNELPS